MDNKQSNFWRIESGNNILIRLVLDNEYYSILVINEILTNKYICQAWKHNLKWRRTNSWDKTKIETENNSFVEIGRFYCTTLTFWLNSINDICCIIVLDIYKPFDGKSTVFSGNNWMTILCFNSYYHRAYCNRWVQINCRQ